MAEIYKVDQAARKFLFEGVQGENEARSIQFDITPWTTELGNGAVTATAKRPTDAAPYPVTVTRDGNTVTWKPTSTDTAIDGAGMFQLEYTVDSVLAKTCIWSTMVAPSLDPAGDPPDPYDNWLAEMRQVAADALQSEQNAEDSAEDAEAWAVGQRGGVDVPSTDETYQNNAKYYAEQSAENQYGAYIVKSASGDIASFSDGGDDIPMKSLKVTITPKQAGSGDPSPDNVRPINGWTDADVHVSERNIFAGAVDEMVPLFLPKLTDVVASASTACVIHYYDINGTEIDYWTINQTQDGRTYRAFRIKSTADCYYVKFTGNATNFQLEKGTTPTAYEAPRTTPVPLGQTVYGGEVDVTTGVLTIDKVFTQRTSVDVVSMGSRPYWRFSLNPTAVNDNELTDHNICNMAKYSTNQADNTCYVTAEGSLFIVFNEDQTLNTKALTDAWLADHPIQFCYELATPTTVQLTPAEVRTLLGTNNVWADCGSVEVEYRADPTLAYNELANVIVSLGGNL